jgi:hypothetical protein
MGGGRGRIALDWTGRRGGGGCRGCVAAAAGRSEAEPKSSERQAGQLTSALIPHQPC